MSTSSDRPGPLSQDELRAAFASTSRARPSPLAARPPAQERAWDWDADGERAERDRLQRELSRLRAQLEEQRTVTERARAHAHDLRDALERLASARPWTRLGVVRELRRQGLV